MNFHEPGQAADEESIEDMSMFGEDTVRSLKAEHAALQQAQIELDEAGARAAASANALLGVYGPSRSRDHEDCVVELSVNGAKMKTLRSTLQACPASQLASQFSKENWPGNRTNQQGPREIACRSSVFSKVLDVSRMQKRCDWTGSQTVRVSIEPVDRELFKDFVHQHFSGCESFIVECVEPADAVLS